jgi:hypothetical protein
MVQSTCHIPGALPQVATLILSGEGAGGLRRRYAQQSCAAIPMGGSVDRQCRDVNAILAATPAAII